MLTSRDESRDPDAVEEFCLFLSFFSFFWLFPLAEGVSYGVFLWFFDWERVPAMSAGVLVWFVSKLNREDTSVSCVLGNFPASVFYLLSLVLTVFGLVFCEFFLTI